MNPEKEKCASNGQKRLREQAKAQSAMMATEATAIDLYEHCGMQLQKPWAELAGVEKQIWKEVAGWHLEKVFETIRLLHIEIARGDIYVPLKCGCNNTFPATRLGCGEEISWAHEVYRCCDCQTPFHKSCLHKHCADELTTVKTALRNLRNECVRLDAECEAGSGDGCGVDGSFLDAAAKALNPNQQSKSEMDGAE